MRILLFGAAWPLGRLIVSAALKEGHHVTAFVGDPARSVEQRDRLEIIQGDVLDAVSVAAVVRGHDVVVGALGRTEQDPAGRFHHPAVGQLAEAMNVHGVSRLVWVSAHGVGDSRGNSGLVFERVLRPLLWRAEYADKERQETAVRTAALEWTIVRPARLTDGPATHRYRAAERIRLNWRSHVSRADVADFVIDESHKPRYLRKCPTLTAQ
jgi:putative NADH-flavin reductase